MTTPTQRSTQTKKPLICLLALILGVTLTPASTAAERTSVAPRGPHPAQPLNVIVFWSTTCGYCEEVLTQMEILRRKLAGTPARFYSARIDDEEAGLIPVAQRRTYGFEIAENGGGLALRYKIPAVPWVTITDCKGNVVASPSADNLPAAVTGYVAMELGFRGYPTRQIKQSVAMNSGAACLLRPVSG